MNTEKAIDLLDNLVLMMFEDDYESDYDTALRMAISALRVSQWIPVSERLPDKPNIYAVTDHEGRVVRYVYNDNESSREYWKRCAKAWMPLPEPYKEQPEGGAV